MLSKNKSLSVKTIVQTGLLISLALVVRSLSYMVYFGGATGMRIGFAGVFTRLAAILSGPFLGGVVSSAVDIIGYLIKPEGAYIPLLTVSAFLGGALAGLLWIIAGNMNIEKVKRVFITISAAVIFIGIVNSIQVNFFEGSYWAKAVNNLGKYREFATTALIITGITGIVLYFSGKLFKRFYKGLTLSEDFPRILFVVLVSGLVVTTLNTAILRVFIPELGKLGFLVFWIPRVIQELLMSLVQAYILSLLLGVYKRHFGKRYD